MQGNQFDWGGFQNFMAGQQNASMPLGYGSIQRAFEGMPGMMGGAGAMIGAQGNQNAQRQMAYDFAPISQGSPGQPNTYGFHNYRQMPMAGADREQYTPFGGAGGRYASGNPYLDPNQMTEALRFDWQQQAAQNRFNAPDVLSMNRGKGYNNQRMLDWVEDEQMGYSPNRTLQQGQLRNQIGTASNSPLMAILNAITGMFGGAGGLGGAPTNLATNFGLNSTLTGNNRTGAPLDFRMT